MNQKFRFFLESQTKQPLDFSQTPTRNLVRGRVKKATTPVPNDNGRVQIQFDYPLNKVVLEFRSVQDKGDLAGAIHEGCWLLCTAERDDTSDLHRCTTPMEEIQSSRTWGYHLDDLCVDEAIYQSKSGIYTLVFFH